MIRLFYSQVLKWLASVKWEDFMRVVSVVQIANTYWQKEDGMDAVDKNAVNATRATHVGNFIRDALPFLTGWKKNVVLELAVAWFNRTAK